MGQQAVPIPDEYRSPAGERKILRSNDQIDPKFVAYLQHQVESIPNFQLPGNFEVGPGGRVQPKKRNVFMEHPELFALAGAGAGAGGGALIGAMGGGGAGAGAGAGLGGVEGGGFGLSAAGETGLGATGSAATAALPTTATAATSSILPAGSTGAVAEGGGLSGALGTAANIGRSVAPILSNMANSRGQAEDTNTRNALTQEQIAQRQPGVDLSNIAKSEAFKNGPVQAHWGGPGSGLRGQILTYSGGLNDPRSPELTSSIKQFQDQQVNKALHPADPAAAGQRGGAVDNALGWGGVAASLIGALARR